MFCLHTIMSAVVINITYVYAHLSNYTDKRSLTLATTKVCSVIPKLYK